MRKNIEGKLGKHSADIFLAQEAILLDSFVVEERKRILEADLINAEQVVRTVFEWWSGNPVTLPCRFARSLRAGSMLFPGC